MQASLTKANGHGMSLHASEPFFAAIERACAALDAASAGGLQPLTGDATFQTPVAADTLRSLALERGVDLGFDAGPEQFATFLALRLCRRWLRRLPSSTAAAVRFASAVQGARHNFYVRPNTFPYDLDTTSVATAALFEAGITALDVLLAGGEELCKGLYVAENVRAAKFLPNPSRADVAMVYFLDVEALPRFFQRPQFDPAVATNVLYAAYLAAEYGLSGAEQRFEPTFRYVTDHLTSGRCFEGTLYYPSPDSFFCLFGLLLARFPARLAERLANCLHDALVRRESAVADDPVRDPSTPLNRAQRIIAADALNHALSRDLVQDVVVMKESLCALQGPDGLWDAGALYGYGPLPFFIGSRELSAAFAVSALGRGALGV
jgi:hypothetical protein